MTNRPTILRIHAAEKGVLPPVTPAEVAAICAHMTTTFNAVVDALGFPTGNHVTLQFAGSPRRGSLELYLEPIFHIQGVIENVQIGIFYLSDGTEVDPLSRLGDAATLGLALWTFLFGGEGIIDLYRKFGRKPVPATGQSELRLQVASRVLSQPNFLPTLQILLAMPELEKWEKVEVVVEDQATVLYDAQERRLPSVLGRVLPDHGPIERLWEGSDLTIYYRGSSVIPAEYEGRPASVFMAQGEPKGASIPPRLVVVWASSQPLPEKNQPTIVRAQEVEPKILVTLVPDGAYPPEFETADAVLLVTAVRTYV